MSVEFFFVANFIWALLVGWRKITTSCEPNKYFVQTDYRGRDATGLSQKRFIPIHIKNFQYIPIIQRHSRAHFVDLNYDKCLWWSPQSFSCKQDIENGKVWEMV